MLRDPPSRSWISNGDGALQVVFTVASWQNVCSLLLDIHVLYLLRPAGGDYAPKISLGSTKVNRGQSEETLLRPFLADHFDVVYI
jgi:hypothetical protein